MKCNRSHIINLNTIYICNKKSDSNVRKAMKWPAGVPDALKVAHLSEYCGERITFYDAEKS